MNVKFQGFSASFVEFRRSRGLEPDSSMVEIWVPDFHLVKFASGPAPLAGAQIVAAGLSQPTTLYGVGDLVLRADVEGKVYERKVERLAVDSISRDGYLYPDGSGMIQVTLVDAREAWGSGFLDRWRFNVSKDSGTATLKELVTYLVGRLRGAGAVTRVPEDWNHRRPPYVFSELGSPREALRRVMRDEHTELCLADDNSVSFWRDGEADDKNPLPPPELVEDMSGSGHVGGVRYHHPPEVILVAGGERFATVRIDHWVPVLMLKGEPVPLDEALMELSGRASRADFREFDLERKNALVQPLLDRLARFLLRPDTWRVLRGFSKEATDIIRRDAYRLWQLPLADGENLEMLPLLKRAERDSGGRRLEPVVRFWTWKRVGKTFRADEDPKLSELLEDLISIRNQIFGDAARFGINAGAGVDLRPYAAKAKSELGVTVDVNLTTGLRFAETVFLFSGQSVVEDRLNEYKSKYRDYVKRVKELDPNDTTDLEDQLQGVLFEAANYLADAGRLEINEALRGGEAGEGLLAKLRAKFGDRALELQKQILEARRAAAASTNVGDVAPPEVFFFVNTEQPIIDREATVENAELGLVRTSGLSAQLERDGLQASVLEATGKLAFGPGPFGSWPVSVEFGTRIVPRWSIPRPTTGPGLPTDIIPPQALEALHSGKPRLGTYHSAWRRGPAEVDIAAIRDERTLTLDRPELVELIELSGATNRRELDRAASEAAQAHLFEESISKYCRTHYVHPHKVRCDGVVSAVSVSTRRRAIGFRTLVVEGATDRPFDTGNRTRERRLPHRDLVRSPALPGEADFRAP